MLLIQDLKKAFNKRYLLIGSVFGNPKYMLAYDIVGISEYCDVVSVVSQNVHFHEGTTNHQSPLFAPKQFPGYINVVSIQSIFHVII